MSTRTVNAHARIREDELKRLRTELANMSPAERAASTMLVDGSTTHCLIDVYDLHTGNKPAKGAFNVSTAMKLAKEGGLWVFIDAPDSISVLRFHSGRWQERGISYDWEDEPAFSFEEVAEGIAYLTTPERGKEVLNDALERGRVHQEQAAAGLTSLPITLNL